MKRTYVVVINIYEFNSDNKRRFYELLSWYFPWSLNLFDDVLVIQDDEDEVRIADLVYECAERIKENCLENKTMAENDGSKRTTSIFQIENLLVCELGNHVINLKDSERSKYLELMLQRGHKNI